MPLEIIINDNIFEQPQELNRFNYENLKHYQIQYDDWNYTYTDEQSVVWQKTLDQSYSNNSGSSIRTYSNDQGYFYQNTSLWNNNGGQYWSSDVEEISDVNGILWTRTEQNGTYILTRSDDASYSASGSYTEINNLTNAFEWSNKLHQSINDPDWVGTYTDVDNIIWKKTEVHEELVTGYTYTTTYSTNDGYLYQRIDSYDYTTYQSINLEKITDINGIVWTQEQQWNGSDITILTN